MTAADDLGKLITIINTKYHEDPRTIGALKAAIAKDAFSDASKDLAKPKPIRSYRLVYDSPSTQFESLYFWILDFMRERGENVQKLTDNFTASTGSGHFGEMGQRATRMQEEGMKIMGMLNQVVKTIINLIYDLKEWEIRLAHYDDAKSDDKVKKEAGMLALKQVWLDNVDMKRGRGSIHQMTVELGYSTLREVFMIANSEKEVTDMAGKDGIINDQVKRILIPRISEFLKWKDYSEKELRKRFAIEKTYLKAEVASLQLYTSWVRPYLKAAEDLRQRGFEKGDNDMGSNPALVNIFNTALFEVLIMGKSEFKIESAVSQRKMPASFLNYKQKRKYYRCNVVDFVFRGIPQKITQQSYGFGGRMEMTFSTYILNDDELKLLKKAWDKTSVEAALRIASDTTAESLKQLKEDIDKYTKDDEQVKKDEEKNKKDKKESDVNPFSALFDLFKKTEKKKDKKEIETPGDIKGDDYIEGQIRALAKTDAVESLYILYDVYKKAHGHFSSFEPFEPAKK